MEGDGIIEIDLSRTHSQSLTNLSHIRRVILPWHHLNHPTDDRIRKGWILVVLTGPVDTDMMGINHRTEIYKGEKKWATNWGTIKASSTLVKDAMSTIVLNKIGLISIWSTSSTIKIL